MPEVKKKNNHKKVINFGKYCLTFNPASQWKYLRIIKFHVPHSKVIYCNISIFIVVQTYIASEICNKQVRYIKALLIQQIFSSHLFKIMSVPSKNKILRKGIEIAWCHEDISSSVDTIYINWNFCKKAIQINLYKIT